MFLLHDSISVPFVCSFATAFKHGGSLQSNSVGIHICPISYKCVELPWTHCHPNFEILLSMSMWDTLTDNVFV